MAKFYTKYGFHIFLIFCIGIIAYSNSFNAPFAFDDYDNIVDNPIIKNLHNFVDSSSVTKLEKYGIFKSRYIGFLTIALNYQLNGIDVTGYHIVNLAIHICNAILVYWLVILTFRTPFFSETKNSQDTKTYSIIALFSALLFIAHPLQTQAVTYIIQRFTSLGALFYILSLVMYIAWRLCTSDSNSKKAIFLYLVSLLSAICAMKTKEFSFTLPFVIVLYEILFFKETIKRRTMFLIPFLLTTLIIPFNLIQVNPSGNSLFEAIGAKTKLQTSMSRSDYLATQFRVIVTYLRLLIYPVGQNIDYDYRISHSFLSKDVVASFFILFSMIISAFCFFVTSCKNSSTKIFRLISFGILWWFITLSIESSFIPIQDVIFEHRVYLPSVGLLISLVATFVWLLKKYQIKNRIGLVIGITIIIILLTATYNRNKVWQSRIALWTDAATKSPNNSRTSCNLGNAYLEEYKTWEALLSFIKSLEQNAANQFARYGMLTTYKMMGMDEKKYGIADFLNAKTMDDDRKMFGIARNNLGLGYELIHDDKKALSQYLWALQLYPGYDIAISNAKNLCARQNSTNELSAICKKIKFVSQQK